MQIVIDIPDGYRLDKIENGSIAAQMILNATKNGTPLPKGHGRLIDAEELTDRLEALSADEWNESVGASKGLDFAIEITDDAPTVLEADKESTDAT